MRWRRRAIAATVLLLTASARGRGAGGGALRDQSRRALPASDADDRAAAFGLTTLQVLLLTRWVMNGAIDERAAAAGGSRCWPA